MVAGVKIKINRTNDHVLGVRCFEYQQARRLQNAQRFLYQCLQIRKLDMFCNVKSRNDEQAFIGQRFKRSKRVYGGNVQAKFTASREHVVVKIHALGVETNVLQEFKPFTPAAAQINGFCIAINRPQWLDERQIHALA